MKQITNLDEYFQLNVSDFANTALECPECGRVHKIPINSVLSGANLLKNLPALINSYVSGGTACIGVIYDRHIEEKLNGLFFEPFDRLNLAHRRVPLGKVGLLLEASTEVGDRAAAELPDEINFLIGIGSGVISDLTKWIATKRHLTFLLMGTAASMNAYTSITGTMTENNIKSTRWLDPAKAVLLDSTFIATAPHEMTCAGVGDLLARQIANADWKLAQRIRGTYFCSVPFQMMAPFQGAYLSRVSNLQQRDLAALEKLSDAILVSGYSMTILNGETSPSSGSEHILSHFFDFQHEIFGKPKNYHGSQVGIGTVIMSTAYDMLREMDLSHLNIDEIERSRPSMAALQLEHEQVFGNYHAVFDGVVAKKRIPDEDFRPYIRNIVDSWERVWPEIEPFLLPASEIRSIMKNAGAQISLASIHRTAEDALQALLFGSRYRPRYTILDLLWEMGLFPEYAQKVLDRSGVLD